MRKYWILFFSIVSLSCDNKSELELAIEYKKGELNISSKAINNLLHDKIEVYYGDELTNTEKEEILSNHEFSVQLEPNNIIINQEKFEQDIIRLTVIESNIITKQAGLDSIIYNYTYHFDNRKIFKIEIDTLKDNSINYLKYDSLYASYLSDLFKWVELNYPEYYLKIKPLDAESGKIIKKMIKLRSGR